MSTSIWSHSSDTNLQWRVLDRLLATSRATAPTEHIPSRPHAAEVRVLEVDSRGRRNQRAGAWSVRDEPDWVRNRHRLLPQRSVFIRPAMSRTFVFEIAMAAPWVEPNENPDGRCSTSRIRCLLDCRSTICAPSQTGASFGLAEERRLSSRQTAPRQRLQAPVGQHLGSCSPPRHSCIFAATRFVRLRVVTSRRTMTATPFGASDVEPSVFLGLKDPAKLVQLGDFGHTTGFTDASGVFAGAHGPDRSSSRTTWRVAKYGTDSAHIFARRQYVAPLSGLRTLASSRTAHGSAHRQYDRFFFFGNVT